MGKAREHYAPSKKVSFLQGLLQGVQGELKKEEEKEAAKQKLLAEMMKLRFSRETELAKVGITARGGIEQAKIGAESRLGVAGITAEAGVTQAGIAAKGGIEQAYVSALAGLRGREITGEYSLKEREMMTGASMKELMAGITSREKMATEGITSAEGIAAEDRAATTEDWMRKLVSGEEVSEADRVSRERIAAQEGAVDIQVAGMRESMERYRVDMTTKVAADRIQAEKDIQEDTQVFEKEMEQFKVDNQLSPVDEMTAKLYTSSMTMLANLAFATAQVEDREAQANLASLTAVYAEINAAAATGLINKYGIDVPVIGVELKETKGFLGIGKRTLPVLTTDVQAKEEIRPENAWKLNEAQRTAAGTPLTDQDKEDLKKVWGLNDAEIEEIDRRIKGE